MRRLLGVVLFLLLPASMATTAFAQLAAGVTAPTVTLNLVQGWNLLGNGSSETLNVASTFGDEAKVSTVWKWVAAKSRWAFYAPNLPDGGAAYASSKGYDYLTSVNGGEGFWVNAKTAFTAQLPAGTLVSSDSFQTSLFPGWNLIATGDNKTASQFNEALRATPPQTGEIPINVITLWAWDSYLAKWYFFAPDLLAKGVSELAGYIASKGYLDFGSKMLDATTGFWVNKAASTAPLLVNSLSPLSKYAANPLSLVTLEGAGFNPNARLHVRFFDATGFSLEIPAARASESAVSVAVPPYIDISGGRFGSATVSVQLVQRSGSETRVSAVITGFTINPLPTPPLANGELTDRWLDLAQYAAPGVKAGLQELETRYSGAPSTVLLRNQMSGLETQMAKMRQAINASIGGSPQTLGTFGDTPLTLDAANRDAMDQLVYAALLALGPNSPSPCAPKDPLQDQLMNSVYGSPEYENSKAGYVGAVLTCTNTEVLDFTTKTVAVLGVLGAVAAATGVALSLPAIATIAAVALVPAVYVMVTQTQAISLAGPSQQAAENLKGAVQLFQDSIFDPLASSLLSVTGQAASLAYDTFFAFKGATEEVMKHIASYDIALSFTSSSTSTTTTSSTTTTAASTSTTTSSTTTTAATTTTTASTTNTTLSSGGPAVSITSASCTVGYRFDFGTIAWNVISAAGSASGPVGSYLYVNQTSTCSAWTDCVRQEGEPASTGWTASSTTGVWSPQYISASVSGAEANTDVACPTQ